MFAYFSLRHLRTWFFCLWVSCHVFSSVRTPTASDLDSVFSRQILLLDFWGEKMGEIRTRWFAVYFWFVFSRFSSLWPFMLLFFNLGSSVVSSCWDPRPFSFPPHPTLLQFLERKLIWLLANQSVKSIIRLTFIGYLLCLHILFGFHLSRWPVPL